MKKLDILAIILLILGGINWGLWGILDFNVVDYVFGKAWIDRVLYVLMGAAGIYLAVLWKNVFTRMKKF